MVFKSLVQGVVQGFEWLEELGFSCNLQETCRGLFEKLQYSQFNVWNQYESNPSLNNYVCPEIIDEFDCGK